MIDINEAVFWVNLETQRVMVAPRKWGRPERRKGYDDGSWCDPIGAAYSQWLEMKNPQRVHLMLETAIDLAMQGIPLETVLRAFAQVAEFKALGRVSFPMCRALTKALIGRSLEPNTMSFEELLEHYGRPEQANTGVHP